MGRPITGSLRRHQNRWWASVPQPGGVGRRREESFASQADARAWLTQAVAAARAGERLPDPDRFRTTKAPRPKTRPREAPRLQPDVASLSRAWMAAAYEDLRRGGPERAERVRRIVEGFLVPWFAPRTTTIADVTYFMAHEWLLHLVGRDRAEVSGTLLGLPPVPGPWCDGEELSLAQAAKAAGVIPYGRSVVKDLLGSNWCSGA